MGTDVLWIQDQHQRRLGVARVGITARHRTVDPRHIVALTTHLPNCRAECIEVPAVAVAPDLFSTAEFLSIGSNDLTQYVTAASRDDARVATLNDASHPAVLRLIQGVARHGQETGTPVSLCGDMASDPRHVPALLAAGLTSLSIAPSRIAAIKAAIAEV